MIEISSKHGTIRFKPYVSQADAFASYCEMFGIPEDGREAFRKECELKTLPDPEPASPAAGPEGPGTAP